MTVASTTVSFVWTQVTAPTTEVQLPTPLPVASTHTAPTPATAVLIAAMLMAAVWRHLAARLRSRW